MRDYVFRFCLLVARGSGISGSLNNVESIAPWCLWLSQDLLAPIWIMKGYFLMLRQLCTSSFKTLHIHNCQLVPWFGKFLDTSVQQLHVSNPVKQYETISFCGSAGRFHSSNWDDLLQIGNYSLYLFPCRHWLSTHWFNNMVSEHSQKTVSISA